MGEAARRSAERYAWPRVADQVTEVYERAIEAAGARGRERARCALGRHPARRRQAPSPPPQRLPSLDPAPVQPAAGAAGSPAAIGLGAAGALGVGLTVLAAQKIGVDNVVESIVRSDVSWVLIASALMALSLFVRAASWYWIVRAALPNRPVRRRDVTSATMIGVLMSATLPARLGEPARALALARRTGRVRETFPVLLGTLVSQTMLNLVALALLGVIIVSSTPLFHSGTQKLFLFSLVPLLLLVVLTGRAVADAAQRQRPPGPPRRRPPPGPDPGARRPRRLPRPAPGPRCRGRPPRCLGNPAQPAGRFSTRSASTTRRGSAPPPRSCSRSTSRRSCRRPRRTSASSSWP